MGSPNARSVIVTVRLTPAEAAALDRERRSVSRSLWVQLAVRKALKPPKAQ